MDTLNATGNALLESLISTKEQLSDAAENFNSQNIFHDANANLVLAVNATFSGAESVVDDLGVFESLDSIGAPKRVIKTRDDLFEQKPKSR